MGLKGLHHKSWLARVGIGEQSVGVEFSHALATEAIADESAKVGLTRVTPGLHIAAWKRERPRIPIVG